jgi:hypothetical protein
LELLGSKKKKLEAVAGESGIAKLSNTNKNFRGKKPEKVVCLTANFSRTELLN